MTKTITLIAIVVLAMLTIWIKAGSDTEIVQSPTLTPTATPIVYTFNPRSRFASESDIEWLIIEKAREYGVRPSLVMTIIDHESGFQWWICHNHDDCAKGGGLFQVIPGTENYCEEKLGRELDMKIPEDNLDCGMWLLKNEGIRHWEQWSGPYYVKD